MSQVRNRNATASAIAADFRLLSVPLWKVVQEQNREDYPGWRENLEAVHAIRNGAAHEDTERQRRFVDYGWLTVASWEEKVALVDALAVAMCEATA